VTGCPCSPAHPQFRIDWWCSDGCARAAGMIVASSHRDPAAGWPAPARILAAGMLNLQAPLVWRCAGPWPPKRPWPGIIALVEQAQARKAPIPEPRRPNCRSSRRGGAAAAPGHALCSGGSGAPVVAPGDCAAPQGSWRHGGGHACFGRCRRLRLFHWRFQLACRARVASPCALGLAHAHRHHRGRGPGARSGLLFRGGDAHRDSLPACRRLFDKTGTLTQGRPEVHRRELAGGSGSGMRAGRKA